MLATLAARGGRRGRGVPPGPHLLLRLANERSPVLLDLAAVARKEVLRLGQRPAGRYGPAFRAAKLQILAQPHLDLEIFPLRLDLLGGAVPLPQQRLVRDPHARAVAVPTRDQQA